MQTATISTKFQISIPKQIREEMHLKAGQQFVFIAKGNILHLVPKRSPEEMRGILKGANPKNYRDHTDRL